MNEYQPLAAVELGQSKVSVAIAEKTTFGIRVTHLCTKSVRGMSRSDVLNNRFVSEALNECLREISEASGQTIRDVVLCVWGQSIKTREHTVTMERPFRDDSQIEEDELRKIRNGAFNAEVAPDEVILDAIPQSFEVDDSIGVAPENVLGMTGHKITAHFKLVIGKANANKKRRDVVTGCGLNIIGTVLSPIGSAMAALSEEERENGVALLDIGAGTTDVVIVKDRTVREVACIPFAGGSITGDIKSTATITTEMAELVKIKYGRCINEGIPEGKKLVIKGSGGSGDKEIALDLLQQIVEARVSEILDAVWYIIEESGYMGRIPSGIVITGGTAYLDYIRELARSLTGCKVRLANAQGNISDSSVESSFNTTACSIVGTLLDSFEHGDEIFERIQRTNATDATPKDDDGDLFNGSGEEITKLSWRESRRRKKEQERAIRDEEKRRKAEEKEAERKRKLEEELAEEAEDGVEEEEDEDEDTPQPKETESKPSKVGSFFNSLFDTSDN